MNRLLLIIAAIATFVVTTSAQIMSNPAQWYINNQIYSMRVFNGTVANSMFRRKSPKSASKPTSGGRKEQPKADVSVFKQSPQSILPAKLTSGAKDANTARTLEAFLEMYRRTAQKDGFPSNDLAYAFEYFVVNNYQIYKDLVEMPPDKDPRAKKARDGFERIEIISKKKQEQVTMTQERAIYAQFRDVLAANPEVAKMTDAQKQEATELLALMYGVNFAAYLKGIEDGDDELTEQARQLARQGLEKLFGTTSDKISITNNGLEL